MKVVVCSVKAVVEIEFNVGGVLAHSDGRVWIEGKDDQGRLWTVAIEGKDRDGKTFREILGIPVTEE